MPIRRLHPLVPALGVVAASLLLAACGSSSSSSSSSSPSSSAAAATSSSSSSAGSAAMSETVAVHSSKFGAMLVGAHGRTVYLWMADKGAKSACSSACAKAWPPVVVTGKPSAGSGVDASKLGTTKRSDGSLQVTYAGHPLYYFVGDTGPGTESGQGSNGFGAKWWVVSPAGKAITSMGGAASSSSSSGYSGY